MSIPPLDPSDPSTAEASCAIPKDPALRVYRHRGFCSALLLKPSRQTKHTNITNAMNSGLRVIGSIRLRIFANVETSFRLPLGTLSVY
jgi:hypothetical protein